MNILEHFDHYARKQEKEHFNHLIQVAMADGKIDESEMEMLHIFGRKMGLIDLEIDVLINKMKQSVLDPPYELSKRFEQLYDVVKMVLADGKIDNNEMRLSTRIAIKSGFVEDEIPGLLLLLINGIRNGEDEEELLNIYKKRKRSKFKDNQI